MMRVLVLLVLACGAAFGAEAPKLPQFDFEQGVQGWEAPGGVGTVRTTPAPEGSRLGKSALEHRYTVEKGKVPILMVALPNGLEGMGSLRLDLATGTQTVVSVAIVEKDGARYDYLSATPDQSWAHLEIDAGEFRLADDTKDANNRLDLADAQMLMVADIRAVLTAIGIPMAKIFGERAGEQAVWLDNVIASPEAAGEKPAPGTVLLDDFRCDNVPWIPISGVTVVLGKAPGDAEGRAVRMDYTPVVGGLTSLFRNLRPGALAGVKSFTLRVASKADVTLAIGAEEVGGARYGGAVTVKGGETLQTVTVPLAAFQAAPGTADANGRLDIDQVKVLSLIDMACFTGERAGQANTVWVQSVTASSAEKP